MASYLDKFKVSTAIDNSTTMDLSCQHITTSDWLNGAPTYIKECVPGEKLRVNVQTFARLAPMAVPSFGRGMIHNRAFFVPMRTVFTNWNEFITNSNDSVPVVGVGSATTTSVNPSEVPIIKNSDLVRLFIERDGTSYGHQGSNLADAVTGASAYNKSDIAVDIVTSGSSPTHSSLYFKFTNRGRRLMKILQSLGYNIMWSFGANASAMSNAVDDTYSALPLLSWLKICLDWYYPSAYVGDDMYRFIDGLIKAHSDGSGAHNLTYDELAYIFCSSFTNSGDSPWAGLMCYDSDYFVSAFDNPLGTPGGNYVAPSSAPINDINFTKGTTNTNNPVVYDSPAGTTGYSTAAQLEGSVLYRPAIITTNNGTRISQYGLDALKALTDYVKRHQLVGARALDRYYARFGKTLSAEKLDRSNYLGCQNIPMQIGDVMCHAESSQGSLGDYAGKGLAYGADGNFEFSTDEYGYFIIVSSVIPTVGFYQGMDRQVLHKGRLDFWTPEFDQLGNQAIAKKELYVPMNSVVENPLTQGTDSYINADLKDGIFGYAPRYAEYKVGRDRVTGDFRYHSYNVGDTSDAWHLMRKIDGLFQDSAQIAHSKYFVLGSDREQYNRIFNSTLTTADKFYLVHDFKVQSTAPMHSLYDTYEFKDEDESKKVVADVNGVKVN